MNDDFRTATERLIKERERDARFRAMTDSAAAFAMEGLPRDRAIEPDDVHDAVLRATSQLLKMVYEGDAELAALRIERDAYKSRALRMAEWTPPRMVVTKEPHPDLMPKKVEQKGVR